MVSVAESEHVDSWYAETTPRQTFGESFEGNVDTRVCVIGGGFTGTSAALHLAERGVEVVLLEANRIGWGASGRNGGQLGSGQRVDQADLIEQFGDGAAQTLWEMAEAAKACVHERIAKHAIDCHYEAGLLYTCFRDNQVAEYEEHAELLNRRYGYSSIRFVDQEEVSALVATRLYRAGVVDTGAGHLHPLRLVSGLAQAAQGAGATIHEHSAVTRYGRSGDGYRVETAGGVVRCDQIVLGTNGYLDALEPRIAPQIMPVNNFIIATEPLGAERASGLIRDNLAVADSKFVVDYFRLSHDHRLLFGGGESYRRRMPSDIAAKVRPVMLKVFPQLANVAIDYAWGGTLAVTMNRLPAWGRIDDRLFFAHGYSGHGLALSVFAGRVLADAVAGDTDRLDFLADLPSPRFPGGTLLRWPGQVAGMLYYGVRDRLSL